MNTIIEKWAELTNPNLPLTGERLKLIVLISIFASTILVLADFTWHYYDVESWAASNDGEIYRWLINTYLDIERDGIILLARNIWHRYSILFWGFFGSDSIVGSTFQYAEVLGEEGDEVFVVGEEVLSERDADALELSGVGQC
ncbi:hypothetical protein OCU04_000085 [Sclerotinia nivalis]|uniref:Uncharacterized protein n=1 Tax=Sclerotinia nivalis TaxID=352851 RepID=A0A9X0AVC6_9HELO|nr:hypothetical protein OCU04_000085 [Sclerotinia nivalis]